MAQVVFAACAASENKPLPSGTPDFVVVAGEDGVALVGADWFEPVPGVTNPQFDVAGERAVGVDATTAAVIGDQHLALVRPHQPAHIVACDDCAGVAFTGEFVVSSRQNYTPYNGFDIVVFRRDLAVDRVVEAERLEERATQSSDDENTESPIVLAADPSKVTVGYLARDGGVRRGPSVVAQYDYQGKLIRHAVVDGILGRSQVSPDGRTLALGVGGSGGACVTVSQPYVVDLEVLRVTEITPAVPAAVSSASTPWFMLTDLVWDGGLLTATGEVHDPLLTESCDPSPETWRRRFDPTSGRLDDATGWTTRQLGPRCEDLIEIRGSFRDGKLFRRSTGSEVELGRYYRMSLGQSAAKPGCDEA